MDALGPGEAAVDELHGSRCTVVMDGTIKSTDDFVAVLSEETGACAIFYNTDAATMGLAIKMLTRAYVTMMHDLSEDDRSAVVDLLGPAFAVPDEEVEECGT